MEQALYDQEGISLPGSAFVDNQPALDLIELKTTGVLYLLDDEVSVPKGNDESFLSKLLKIHEKKHPNMLKPSPKDCHESQKCFGILHYAGPVYYYVPGFLEKNKDQISQDILSLLRESKLPLMRELYPKTPNEDQTSSKQSHNKQSLGAQFKTQLNQLIDTLNATNPHFIRCMKSNDKKVRLCLYILSIFLNVYDYMLISTTVYRLQCTS